MHRRAGPVHGGREYGGSAAGGRTGRFTVQSSNDQPGNDQPSDGDPERGRRAQRRAAAAGTPAVRSHRRPRGRVLRGRPEQPARSSCCCTAFPTTSTVTSTSSLGWSPPATGSSSPTSAGTGPPVSWTRTRPDPASRPRSAAMSLGLLDALHIPRAVLAGFDWGGRAACVAAALWPGPVLGHRVRQQLPDSGHRQRHDADPARSGSRTLVLLLLPDRTRPGRPRRPTGATSRK